MTGIHFIDAAFQIDPSSYVLSVNHTTPMSTEHAIDGQIDDSYDFQADLQGVHIGPHVHVICARSINVFPLPRSGPRLYQ